MTLTDEQAAHVLRTLYDPRTVAEDERFRRQRIADRIGTVLGVLAVALAVAWVWGWVR